jgi:hypothetical protein
VINKTAIQKLRDKEMDRKDFLKYSGVVLVGVVGLKGIVNLLTQVDAPKVTKVNVQQSGRSFGGGKYGA